MDNDKNEISTSNEINISTDLAFNPDNVIKNAAAIATSLANIINQKKLFTIIQGNKYVHATGWGIMMAMNRVSPCVVKSVKLDREDEIAYEAEVELFSHDNRIIGRASAICSSKEPSKRGQPEYVIKSMAQTRATSKAARLSFAWIMQLAGYEATPSNEMEDVITNNKKRNGLISLNSTGVNVRSILEKIKQCTSIEDLSIIYKEFCDLGPDKETQGIFINKFAERKKELQRDVKERMIESDVPQ